MRREVCSILLDGTLGRGGTRLAERIDDHDDVHAHDNAPTI
jgi:hypothetical protein